MMGTRRFTGSGIVYRTRRLQTHTSVGQEPRKRDAPQLRDEYRTYKILAGSRQYAKILPSHSANIQIVGIPNVYYLGQDGFHNILVVDLLGPSFEDCFDSCNRRFSTKTVVMVAKQMVRSLLSLCQYLCLSRPALENSNNPRKEPHLP